MIDINKVLKELEFTNPNGFIIESHFQVEFGYALKRIYPEYNITFEWSKDKKRVDIFAESENEKVGFEFKYFTMKETRTLNNGLVVELKNQTSRDLHRIGFWKDVEKLEGFKAKKDIDRGYCLFLTNDKKVFLPLSKSNHKDYDFDLSDGPYPGNRELKYFKGTSAEPKYDVKISGEYVLCRELYGNGLYLLVLPIK